MKKYKIIKFFAPHLNKTPQVIKTNLTLEEAKTYCSQPDTKKEGKWLCGFEEQ